MMRKLLRAGILIIFGMLIIGIISGCSDDNPPEKVVEPPQLEDDAPPPPTITVVVDPPPGGDIDERAEFTLWFNEEVVAVTVNDKTATGSGLTWKVVPYLPLGPGKTLNIKWTNREGFAGTIEVGPYSVWIFEFEPPIITSGTVSDGDADVDPAPINSGGFRFDFDADVTGTIKLVDEVGADLNWIGAVAGQTATLTAVAGQELVNETTYKIQIDVKDGAGNSLQTTITFVTKPK